MKKPVSNHFRPKVIVLAGPTASGKSELAVALAKKFNGEIISADSRQIYKGMDIGTGKVKGRWQHTGNIQGRGHFQYAYKGIAHHLIDFISPSRHYSVARFKQAAQKAIKDILNCGKLPIICGGTGHWIDAVVYNQTLPDVKPDKKLRAKLEKQSAEVLYHRLAKLDPVRASSIDRHNKRRLIRALEIIHSTGKPVPSLGAILAAEPKSGLYDVLWLGIKTEQTELYKKIQKRLKLRIKAGMVGEAKKLHAKGLSWRRLESFGLEYRFVSLYLQKKLSYDEMFTRLLFAIKHYSKRQMTWWKRNKQIKWVKPEKNKITPLILKFLKA